MRRLLIVLLFLLAGCTAGQLNENLSTPQDRELALKAIESLRSGHVDELKSQMDPELFAQTSAESEKIKQLIAPAGSPELVTVSTNMTSIAGNTETLKALNYEMGTGQKWSVVQIVLHEAGPATTIVGWHATPFDRQPTSAGDFTFDGKSPINYAWIAIMLACTLTSLIASVLAFRSKGLRRRWLWIIGCVVCLGQFNLSWATGGWAVRPIAFSILGSAFIKASPFDPWILTFSLPVFAIVFLVRRKSLVETAEAEWASFGG